MTIPCWRFIRSVMTFENNACHGFRGQPKWAGNCLLHVSPGTLTSPSHPRSPGSQGGSGVRGDRAAWRLAHAGSPRGRWGEAEGTSRHGRPGREACSLPCEAQSPRKAREEERGARSTSPAPPTPSLPWCLSWKALICSEPLTLPKPRLAAQCFGAHSVALLDTILLLLL